MRQSFFLKLYIGYVLLIILTAVSGYRVSPGGPE